jgi:hypothetical protein
MERVTKWIKSTFGGDKCQVEDMQYILLALVYFGYYYYYDFFPSGMDVEISHVQKGGSGCMENVIITLSSHRIL